jgi:uncharacterized protein
LQFVSAHNELLLAQAQADFGSCNTNQEWHEASCLMMGLALHLGRAIGAKTNDLATHWIAIAKEHGALD